MGVYVCVCVCVCVCREVGATSLENLKNITALR